MKYEVALPDEIDQLLSHRATEIGEDVPALIRVAVDRYVDEIAPQPKGEWTPEGEARRRELIDKDISGKISPEEQSELAHLDQLANEHFDRVAPPPLEGAQRLHGTLLGNSAKRYRTSTYGNNT